MAKLVKGLFGIKKQQVPQQDYKKIADAEKAAEARKREQINQLSARRRALAMGGRNLLLSGDETGTDPLGAG